MPQSTMTHHARKRIQQRAIPPFVIELLHQFGSSVRCDGADRLIFDKAARKRLTSHFGHRRALRTMERWLRVYVVLGDSGAIVTVAYQTKHIRRDT